MLINNIHDKGRTVCALTACAPTAVSVCRPVDVAYAGVRVAPTNLHQCVALTAFRTAIAASCNWRLAGTDATCRFSTTDLAVSFL